MPIDDVLRARLAALEGLISPAVGEQLAALAADVMPPDVIVEIGSYKGKSTAYLATGAIQAGRGAEVYAVDPWDSAGNVGGRFGFDRPETFRAFRKQLVVAGVHMAVTPIRGFSVEVASRWGRRVGMLYIDGSHTEKDVAADVLAWFPHLADRCIVAFDDYDTPRNPGVKAVVDRLMRDWPGWSWHLGPEPLIVGRR